MKKPLPLPSKKGLRAAAMKYKKPSKSVLSYFKGQEHKDLAVVEKSLIIAHRRVYCVFFYDLEGLVFAGFINPQFESIGLRIRDNKWTQNVFYPCSSKWDAAKNKYIPNYEFLTESVGAKFFGYNKDESTYFSLKSFIHGKIWRKKEAQRHANLVKGIRERDVAQTEV